MSGVLDRMAKRARGALPTVEPRSTPLFAPASSGFAEKEASGAGMQGAFAQELMDDVESSRHVSDGWTRKTRPSPVEADEPQTLRDNDLHASSTRESLRSATVAKPAGVHPEETGPRPHRLNSQEPDNSHQEPEQRITGQQPGVEQNRRGNEIPGPLEVQRSLPQAPADSAMDRLRDEEANSSESIAATVGTAAEKGMEDSGQSSSPVRIEGSPLNLRHQEERSAPVRNVASAPASAPYAEQKTEIHISIGSIELRAPRVESRPPSAPFRPRVTLSDFLGRKPETGA